MDSSPLANESNWAWLPEDLLILILTELFLLSDMVSLGSVCARWRSVFKDRFQDLNIRSNMYFSRKQPMLLVPSLDNSNGILNLYSVRGEEVYDLRLPVPFNSRCIGSCHGWLIFLDGMTCVVTLFNPFYFGLSKGTIHLPPFLKAKDCFKQVDRNAYNVFPEYYISKAVLSADPLSCSYSVMLVYSEFRCLAHYKAGDETWTCFAGYPLIYDLIYFNGRFAAIEFCGELLVWDPESNSTELQSASRPIYDQTVHNQRRYIVASSDGNTLFQAVRWLEFTPGQFPAHRTLSFSVYKLMSEGGSIDWLAVSDIGDAALFVGNSYSCYVKASDFPGINPNSIYFTDDYHGYTAVYRKACESKAPSDSGIYLIGDGTFRDHYKPREEHKHLPPPIGFSLPFSKNLDDIVSKTLMKTVF